MIKIENNPIVSVVIPTYNRAHLIGRAIQSVINQTYQDYEIIVVDDGSTDNTKNVVNTFTDERVKYISLAESSGGSAAPRNMGVKSAKGEYIASLDDDDFWFDEDKLMKQVEFLNVHSDVVLVGTNTITVDDNNTELSHSILPEKDDEIRKKMLEQNCFIHSSVMFRRFDAMSLGGYCQVEGTSYSNDYDLWLKLGTIGKMANLSIYGVKYTVGHTSFSANENKITSHLKNFKLVKKYRDEYPNYRQAVCFLFLNFAKMCLMRFPPILFCRKNLKSRYPNVWCAINIVHKVFIQSVHRIIIVIQHVLKKAF